MLFRIVAYILGVILIGSMMINESLHNYAHAHAHPVWYFIGHNWLAFVLGLPGFILGMIMRLAPND